MSDGEALGAAVTIWLAVVLLTLAEDYVTSVRVVNREKPSGVEGHADEPKREAVREPCEARATSVAGCMPNVHARGFAAERERRQRMEPALAGIKSGLGFSRFTSVGRRGASLGPQVNPVPGSDIRCDERDAPLGPAAMVPEEHSGGAQGRDTIQTVGIANDTPGRIQPSRPGAYEGP